MKSIRRTFHGSVASVVLAFFPGLTSSAATLFVWQNSPSPAPPYATWATAATSIQNAIDAAIAGDEIVVTNGVYATGSVSSEGNNRIVVGNSIRVRSVNGPLVTVIEGAPPSQDNDGLGLRCVYLAAEAVLSGFTLTNGHTAVPIGLVANDGAARCEATATLSNCIIVGSSAQHDGGGVAGGIIRSCRIAGNRAGDDGGGADRATLFNCFIQNNQSVDDGGGADDCTLYNCVLTGNVTRGEGGGTYESTLFNCTLTENSARRGGGACGRLGLEEMHPVYNSILYHNRAPSGSNHFAVALRFSCTTPLPIIGSDNISADPQLVSASHIAIASPCVGAGSANDATGLDIDGQAWANPPSLGADQVVPGGVTGPLSATLAADYFTVATGFNVPFRADIDGQASASRWSFSDGTVLSNRLTAEHSWPAPGTYPVVLTAFNDSYPGGISSTALVQVVSGTQHFVNRATSNPQFPFATWETAAASIQDAIGAGTLPGRVVWVTNGIYDNGGVAVFGQMTNRVALTNAVFVRSVNGPAVTLLRGRPQVAGDPHFDGLRCAYVGHGSVLSGFTLTNGHTGMTGDTSKEMGGGGAWCQDSGVLTNCVILGNHAAKDGGGVNGGRLFHCALIGNGAGDDGGGADSAALTGCTLSGNRAAGGGGGADESSLQDCLLSGNSAEYGGGAEDSTLSHCTLAANDAGAGGGAFDSTLARCSLAGNSALFGGGAFVSILEQCRLIDNKATNRTYSAGGGAGASLLANCVLWGNLSTNSGGASDSRLFHCTISGNSAHTGGGVGGGEANNCIIYFNTAVEGPNYGPGPNFVAHYTLTLPLPVGGVGNISAAPLFVNPASGDFHLRPGSPGIDAGANQGTSISHDLDGNRRPLDGNRDGIAALDLGAYEFNPLFFTSITKVGSNVRLCWFDMLPGMQLQAASSLDNSMWTNVPFAPGTNCLELPPGSGDEFFRLVAP